MKDVIYRRCCGLDVHKDTIAACVRWTEETGESHKENRVFGTTTQELEKLAGWMEQHQVRQVAMESTGVYWRPVWNVLEGRFEIRLANAQHIRNLPGKKTDRKDGEWIAKLLQHDLVPASFVPPTPIRQLRDLTRRSTRNKASMRVTMLIASPSCGFSFTASTNLRRACAQQPTCTIFG